MTIATITRALLPALAALPVHAQTRGELLYSTHCITCHTTQIHWRDNRLATDWPSLARQVRRWQGNASLGWSESDVLDVTRHLNERIYHFTPPQPAQTLSSVAQRRVAAPSVQCIKVE